MLSLSSSSTSLHLYLTLVLAHAGLAVSQCDTLPGGDTCPATGTANFPDPTDCTFYYVCTDGCAVRTQCEKDFLYDSVYKYCNYPYDVTCGERPCTDPSHCITTTQRPPTTPTTPDCSGHDPLDCRGLGDGWYSDPYNCRRYWHCTERQAEKFFCDTDMVYDEVNVWCDAPERVDCGDRPICDNCDKNCHEQPTPTPTKPDCGHPLDCSTMADGFYPDSFNCRKYWQCSGGVGYHFICEGDLLYDPENVWCDFPESVVCGDRPICGDCDENCQPQI